MVNEQQLREEIVRFGRLLHQHAFIAATDGNMSIRLDGSNILSTPTAISKGMMTPEDLVVVDMKGRQVSGWRPMSTEIGMHLLIYRLRPDVCGIVHAHPVTATGYAAAGLPLNRALLSEVALELGGVPLARYGTPGTPELSEALQPLIPKHNAILMANHGVVTYGESLLRAYMRMETVEHFAKIALITHLLGQQQPLSERELEKLAAAHPRECP